MKLVIDGHRLTQRRTGVGRVLEILLDEWAATGWPLERTMLITQQPVDRYRWHGLEIKTLGSRLPGLVWHQFVLSAFATRDDILFCPTNLLPATRASHKVLFIFDTLLESVPETFPWHVHARFRPRYRSSARRASVVITPSDSTRRDVINFYGLDPLRVRKVALATDPIFEPGPAKGEPGFRPQGASPFFLVVGKKSRRRHLHQILEAFAEHRWHHPDDKLILVGPDSLSMAAENVIALGHLPDADLVTLYRSARATLYLSEYEGFGLPILEAQSCGCPVVTLRNSALPETAGEGALYLDKAEPASVQWALERLSTDADLRASLSLQGLQNAARFSRTRFGNEIRSLLLEVAHPSAFST